MNTQATRQKIGYRISLKGDGQILNPAGNPVCGHEKERLCLIVNLYEAHEAVAEVAKAYREARFNMKNLSSTQSALDSALATLERLKGEKQ